MPQPRRPRWPWLVAGGAALALVLGGVAAFLLLRSPDPQTIARELEELRAEASARQDADLLRQYYADPAEAVAEAEGFYPGARVQVVSVRVVTADEERIVAHVVTREPGVAGEPSSASPYEGDITYELVPLGGGEEGWRVTDYE